MFQNKAAANCFLCFAAPLLKTTVPACFAERDTEWMTLWPNAAEGSTQIHFCSEDAGMYNKSMMQTWAFLHKVT